MILIIVLICIIYGGCGINETKSNPLKDRIEELEKKITNIQIQRNQDHHSHGAMKYYKKNEEVNSFDYYGNTVVYYKKCLGCGKTITRYGYNSSAKTEWLKDQLNEN